MIAGNPPEDRVRAPARLLGARVVGRAGQPGPGRHAVARAVQLPERRPTSRASACRASSSRASRRRWSCRRGSPAALSFYDTAPLQGDAGGAGRLRPARATGRCASASARSTSAAATSPTSTPRDAAPAARAHHGLRRAAARLAAGPDRGRGLLGRRPRLQHAAAVRPRLHRRAQRQVHLPGRPVQRARGDAAEPVRRGPAREGHPLFQPHPPQHRQLRGRAQTMRHAIGRLLGKLPAELRSDPDAAAAGSSSTAPRRSPSCT